MDNQQPSDNLFYLRPKKGNGFIYRYISPVNKVYIGQTVNSLAERAKNIVSGIGYKKCSVFWSAIQKYHFVNFKVDILEEVEIQKLNEREQLYIKKFNSLVPNGYNLYTGGEKGKTVEVYVYSAQNGKFLEHYNSLTEASLFTGVPIETISSILSNKNFRRIAHNYIFLRDYKEEINLLDFSRRNYRHVYVYISEGKFLQEFETIAEASRKLKIATCTIERHLTNKKLTCGYYFRDKKQDKIETIENPLKKGKKVRKIDPNTFLTIDIYPSVAAAARAVGLSSSSSIMRAIKRDGKAKGFYWQIIEGSTTTQE